MSFRERLDIDASAYRLVHGEGDLIPSLVDRPVRRLHRAAGALAGDRSSAAGGDRPARGDGRARKGSSRATIRVCGCSRGSSRPSPFFTARFPTRWRCAKGRSSTTSTCGTARKPARFSTSARIASRPRQYVSGRTLDCFSYAGGFALQLAPHVDELTALDISEDATALLARNAARNGLSNVQVRTTNVFDELRTLERMGETFDSIVLDPPAFAKSKAAIPKALSGYKEINLRALKLLKPGGFLITCSCSYHVNEGDVRGSDPRRGARRAAWTSASSRSGCRAGITRSCSGCRRRTI